MLKWLYPKNWPFVARLIVPITLLVILFLVGLTLLTTQQGQTTLSQQVGNNLETQAESLNQLMSLFLLGNVNEIQAVSLSEDLQHIVAERNAGYSGPQAEILQEIQQLDEAWLVAADDDPLIVNTINPDNNPIAHQLLRILENFEEHVEIFVTDRYGATIGATGRLSDYYQADEDWWQAAWNDGQGAVYLSQPEFDESSGVTAVLIGVPIYDEESGQVLGILRSTLVFDELLDLFETIRVGETGYALLLDGNGETLLDPRARGGGDLPAELRNQIRGGQSGFQIGTDTDGRETIFAYNTVGGDSLEFEVPTLLEDQALAGPAGY